MEEEHFQMDNEDVFDLMNCDNIKVSYRTSYCFWNVMECLEDRDQYYEILSLDLRFPLQ